MPQPDSAAMMCSIVDTDTPSAFSTTVHSRDGVTASHSAGTSGSRPEPSAATSLRRKRMPLPAGGGQPPTRRL